MDLALLGESAFATRWEEMVNCKKRFLLTGEDPRNSPYMRPEIAESWIRSKSFGVDPYMKKFPKMPSENFKNSIDANQLLIDTALPLINTFSHLLNVSGYIVALHANDCSLLYLEGDKVAASSFKSFFAMAGAEGSEQAIGTTAHSLSMRLKKPVQLLGPENYCLLLEDNISSACPIVSEEGQVIGSLVLVTILPEYPWESESCNLLAHTLGWVSSMGMAIESQMQLSRRNTALFVTNGTLEATLESVNEGIISVDQEGKIKHLNREAARILHVGETEAIGRDFESFLGNQPGIVQALTSENLSDFPGSEVHIQIDESGPYLLSAKSILNNNCTKIGALLCLTPAGKVNASVNHAAGVNPTFRFEDIIGNSEPIKKVKSLGKYFALTSENVLLTGESGTGKELFAQAIHNEYRSSGPFVAINCAAIPKDLIQSELFGYEGGAFTGAERKGRPGKIELANGGTLFLDEIGDMPLEIQAVLLRVLETKQVMRLGGQKYLSVDFRVIAATNQDLAKMVTEKSFRQDLYYRLSVLKIVLPPLRERGADILLLCRYFIDNYSKRRSRPAPELSHEAEKKLAGYDWPGNVRQLENAVIRAINLAREGVITLEHLPDELVESNQPRQYINTIDTPEPTEVVSMKEAEVLAITNALMRCGKNMSLAADLLGIGKSTLYKKIKDYHLAHLIK